MADDNSSLDAEDFSDVFGGPPRSVLCRKYSGDFTRSSSFYEEVFRPPEFFSSQATKGGRSLPAFRIPARSDGFYSDIFGSDDDIRRSRERSRSNSKAKSNSSSVLSSEELSPLRPAVGDDVGLSSFASKLRPINVPCRWNSTTMMPEQQLLSAFPSSRSFYNENLYMENEYINGDNLRNSNSYYGFSRRATSPEIISLEPHSFRSVKISADDLDQFNSPSSPASSLCQEPETRAGMFVPKKGQVKLFRLMKQLLGQKRDIILKVPKQNMRNMNSPLKQKNKTSLNQKKKKKTKDQKKM
ncbi:hypothetical protein CCACVL1_18957 [Corchorus capsularis]|uniref:Uncharacterized protein n=1 Tax=Corchorus capsularis TaxID=210143 RepID=A0A1R3HJ65_COCAP|nr:hypothetical protein CCACVL1_18957 [Corchorus capsularis]